MYRSFSIKNFRCFDELTVEGMGRINLIAGKNNVGKTALLEALWVHSGGAAHPQRFLRLDIQRGLGPINPVSAVNNLFYSFDNSIELSFSALGDWGKTSREMSVCAEELDRVQVPLDISEDDMTSPDRLVSEKQLVVDYSDESGKRSSSKTWFVERRDQPGQWDVASRGGRQSFTQSTNCLFLSSRNRVNRAEDANRYGELEVNRKQNEVLEILQQIQPDVKRLVVIPTDRLTSIYADMGVGQLIPMRLMGDGMSSVLSLALAIASAPGGIVLVDEIENGIHHSVMDKVWRAIGAFARNYDVQLFATTHSYECIGAAHRAFEADDEDELRLFRIERTQEGKYRSVKFDKERLGAAIDFNMEII